MAKLAISVTLRDDNLTWLKARVGAVGARSVSELIDTLVTDARTKSPTGQMTSVVGTIDIDPSDPLLRGADDAIQELVRSSLTRPALVKESRAPYRRGSKRRG
jgi:hypothetical protein